MRVLLVEEGWTQTVDVARALEARGFFVTVLTANGSRARYRRRSVTWLSGPRVTDVALAHQVAELAQDVDRIVPMTERVMALLWAAGSPAIEARLFPAAEPWQRALVTDKHRLLDFLRARGVEVPRQVPLSCAAELGLPVVLKASVGAAGTHVHIVDTAAGREQRISQLTSTADVWVAQEHIEGPTYLVGGLLHDGTPLRLYAAEKLEQYPVRTGPAIRLRSCDDPALVDAGLRALALLRWTGLASVDLMRRPDGQYVVLEVNPRPWGSLAGAHAAGVDLLAGLAELLGGRVPRADLAYQSALECLIFPRYLLAPAYRSVAGLSRALRDLGGDQGRDWRHPGFALHLIRRVL